MKLKMPWRIGQVYWKIDQVKELVDEYLPRIRAGTGIDIEDITIIEKPGPFRDYIMSTDKGYINIDTKKAVSKDFSIEYVVLHELGHRAQGKINSEILMMLYNHLFRKIDRTKYGDSLREQKRYYEESAESGLRAIHIQRSILEGFAEFFALDIFPEYVELSDPGQKFIESLKERYIEGKSIPYGYDRQTHSYLIFSGINKKYGFDYMKSFIKDFSEKDIPTNEEFKNPELYVERCKERAAMKTAPIRTM